MIPDRVHREFYWTVLVLILACIITFAPDVYLLMLVRAFIVPASGAALLIALFAGLRRKWWLAQGTLVAAALLLQGGYMASRAESPANGKADLRILHMNVLQPNTAYQATITRALASDADLISVQEVGPEWAVALAQGLRTSYLYAHVEPRTNCYGIALFSRVPFLEVRTFHVNGAPFIEACFDHHGKPVRVVAVHASSPISYGHFKRRNAQLAHLGASLSPGDIATIVVGDLNTVTWDGAFKRLCRRSGLRSISDGGHRTWPRIGPFAIIPLDHVLVSPWISATVSTEEIPGSDHRAVLADLKL